MTDKHIKEGIDLSQCECYSVENNSCNDTLSGSCIKEKCQIFRLFQTIKTKEQECEELKKTIMYKCPQCGEEYLSPIGASLYEENYQLKAENEELKRQHQGDKGLITSTGKMNYRLIQEYDKLKTALTEIKEIAKQEIDSKEFMIVQCMLNGSVDDKNKVLKQILQKISEVEDDNR